MELRFTVWQFVRLMVHLELNPDPQFEPWADIWQTLDVDLLTLSESDPEGFSDMMMNQDVVLGGVTTGQIIAIKTALSAVMDQLDAEIETATETTEQALQHLNGLKFERRELRQLTRKLKHMVDPT